MKVCTHKGWSIAVLTRNEHCPPHVHVGSADWDARFEFSFWHDGVRLLDVMPVKNQPTAAVLEGLRQTLKIPKNLRRARICWWQSVKSVCLMNKMWDDEMQSVVPMNEIRNNARIIQAEFFDAQIYKTILQLNGVSVPVEIEL